MGADYTGCTRCMGGPPPADCAPCPACALDRARERWAIRHEADPPGTWPPELAGDPPHTCPPPPAVDVLAFAPAELRRRPQRGTPRRMAWGDFAVAFAEPQRGTDKAQAGGWAAGQYREGIRRRSHLATTPLLVVDVDAGGDVEAVAAALESYSCIVHETFSSTPEAPRCRIVLRLSRPVDAETYRPLHAVVRAHLAARGVVADAAAKDPTRLSYRPVRRPGDSYAFRVGEGAPVPVEGVLAARPEPEPPPQPPRRPPTAQHRDAYVAAALRRAGDAVAAAAPGTRHGTLFHEAWSLARLGLAVGDVEAELLPPAVQAMGRPREREARRTIRDAVRARTKGSRS